MQRNEGGAQSIQPGQSSVAAPRKSAIRWFLVIPCVLLLAGAVMFLLRSK